VPGKPSSLLSIDIWFLLITASMAVLGEKLGGGPADHSVGLRVVSGALFSGAIRSVQRC
jgi:hypothetical protein